MNQRTILLTLFLTSGLAAIGFAQDLPKDLVPAMPIPAGTNLPMEVPAGPNAWVLRITSGGGFSGQYRGLVVTSQGSVRCSQEIQCRGTLSGPELQSFAALLSGTAISKWREAISPPSPILGVCNDCVRVWLELRLREQDGSEKLYSITWDDTSKSTLPAEVKQIYETAASFRR